MSVPLLEVSGVAAMRGQAEAVRDASMLIEQGSVHCVCGPNGAGKTSLLLIIAGILRLRRGSIRLAGLEITECAPHERVALGISLVPQERQLFHNMSVHENLWAGAVTRSKRAQIATDIQHLYDRFEILRTHQHRLAGALSGGEQQVVAIARGTLSRPKLLLLDEPTTGLSPRSIEDMRLLLMSLLEHGTAILLVEHNLRFALTLANRLYCMSDGRLLLSDGHAQILAQLPEAHAPAQPHFPGYASN